MSATRNARERTTLIDPTKNPYAIEMAGGAKSYMPTRSHIEVLYDRLVRRRAEAAFAESLTGIDFSLPRGGTLGIIGLNGSGKTTLLRVLAGHTSLTRGSLTVNGRTSSLIHLGAGFDPEFTGRENVMLSCIARGLTRAEAEAASAEIVAFADLREKTDQPMRTYSAGMMMRLGFAVAVCVPFDILLLDEVIGVGDMPFIVKCNERIAQFIKDRKTLVFASHDLHLIRETCERVMWLEKGRIRMLGPANEVCTAYRDATLAEDDSNHHPAGYDSSAMSVDDARSRNLRVWMGPVEMLVDGKQTDVITSHDKPVTIRYALDFLKLTENPVMGAAIIRADGVMVYGPNTQYDRAAFGDYLGPVTVELHYPRLPLLNGTYHIEVGIYDESGGVCFNYAKRAFTFRVATDYRDYGVLHIPHRWNVARGGASITGEERPDDIATPRLTVVPR